MSFELDWFPLYADRLLGSRKVRRMGALDFGIYMALLVEEWSEGGPLPDDDEELSICGKAPIEDVRKILNQCFTQNGQSWQNNMLEEIRAEQLARRQKRVEAGRKGGLSKGEVLLKQCPSSREEEKRKKEKRKDSGSSYSTEFEQWWDGYPRKVEKRTAFKAWKARLRAGAVIEDLTIGRDRYLAYCQATGFEVKYPATFLGPDEYWKEEYSVPQKTVGTQGGADGAVLPAKFSEPMEPIIHERPASTSDEVKGNTAKVVEDILERAKVKS
jgi:uncharacterized protein YdaU (DUF1376 family)